MVGLGLFRPARGEGYFISIFFFTSIIINVVKTAAMPAAVLGIQIH
jgi:hypothetical protein